MMNYLFQKTNLWSNAEKSKFYAPNSISFAYGHYTYHLPTGNSKETAPKGSRESDTILWSDDGMCHGAAMAFALQYNKYVSDYITGTSSYKFNWNQFKQMLGLPLNITPLDRCEKGIHDGGCVKTTLKNNHKSKVIKLLYNYSIILRLYKWLIESNRWDNALIDNYFSKVNWVQHIGYPNTLFSQKPKHIDTTLIKDCYFTT